MSALIWGTSEQIGTGVNVNQIGPRGWQLQGCLVPYPCLPLVMISMRSCLIKSISICVARAREHKQHTSTGAGTGTGSSCGAAKLVKSVGHWQDARQVRECIKSWGTSRMPA
eukprot:1160822-Pelagomonas_calceolata.AAC.2